MITNKNDIDNFISGLTELSRKYGLAVHGFDGGAFLANSENMGDIICVDGDFWWNEKDKKYEIKNIKFQEDTMGKGTE
ncbi:hypothetical protein AGMMS4952_13990 [Spirochaetia bacterium]|nr:hypothetical protein AGMMS4952_13990 [Spirochaetia bacterium]